MRPRSLAIMIDAYEMTQFPPKAGYKFHPAVIVRVALTSEMGYDGHYGLPKSLSLTDPRNMDWMTRLKAWTSAANRVYIWQYTYHGKYVLTPLPNYFIVAEDIATLNSLGIKGWFSESVCCHPREEMVRPALCITRAAARTHFVVLICLHST